MNIAMSKPRVKETPKRKTTVAPQNPRVKESKQSLELAFGKENYILLAVSFLIVAIGFVLMVGTEDIYSFRKITLAPIVVISGFVFAVYAIMKKPRDKQE
jgi:hypothetical protein